MSGIVRAALRNSGNARRRMRAAGGARRFCDAVRGVLGAERLEPACPGRRRRPRPRLRSRALFLEGGASSRRAMLPRKSDSRRGTRSWVQWISGRDEKVGQSPLALCRRRTHISSTPRLDLWLRASLESTGCGQPTCEVLTHRKRGLYCAPFKVKGDFEAALQFDGASICVILESLSPDLCRRGSFFKNSNR